VKCLLYDLKYCIILYIIKEDVMFKGLSEKQKAILEYEIISNSTRVLIARLFRHATRREDADSDIEIIHKNRIINIARTIEGLPLYVLESDGDGYYLPAEKAWHFGELEIIPKRQNTIELIETLCDIADENIIPTEEINAIFENDNSKFIIENNHNIIEINIIECKDIPDDDIKSEHPNIRKLIERMEFMYSNNDFAGVLHSSATIFETLAKDLLKNPSIENKSFGGFFTSYRNKSKLSETVIDTIENIYKKRNTEPLAGHGSTLPPNISNDEAVLLIEMTKAFIRMERRLNETVLKNI